MARFIAALCTLLALAPGALAQLEGPMSRLDPMLGTWSVSGTWAWGATVDARAEYAPGVAGRFLKVRTWVSDNKEPEDLRYESTVSHDAEADAYRIFSAKFDGTTTDADWTLEERDGADAWVSSWSTGTTTVREELSVRDADTMRWLVRMRQAEDAPWQTVLDADWVRTNEEDAVTNEDNTIRAGDFAEVGRDARALTKTITIDAPRPDVYRAWTDAEAFKAAYAPESEALTAHIDPAIGGRYEWLFDGETGSNGCKVLCYLPGDLIAFTWDAPPNLETRGTKTWVVVRLTDAENGSTKVTLTHAGFGTGDEWDATRDYFDRAWDHVLMQFAQHLPER